MTELSRALSGWLAAAHGLRDLTADTPLFSSARLDSLALVDLLEVVERASGVKVRWSDVSLDHFDTLARIEAYVASRR